VISDVCWLVLSVREEVKQIERYANNSWTKRYRNSYIGEAEGDGRVRQVHDPHDRCVVNVHITDEGRGVLEQSRSNARNTLAVRWLRL
jgi:hypothetical protein